MPTKRRVRKLKKQVEDVIRKRKKKKKVKRRRKTKSQSVRLIEDELLMELIKVVLEDVKTKKRKRKRRKRAPKVDKSQPGKPPQPESSSFSIAVQKTKEAAEFNESLRRHEEQKKELDAKHDELKRAAEKYQPLAIEYGATGGSVPSVNQIVALKRAEGITISNADARRIRDEFMKQQKQIQNLSGELVNTQAELEALQQARDEAAEALGQTVQELERTQKLSADEAMRTIEAIKSKVRAEVEAEEAQQRQASAEQGREEALASQLQAEMESRSLTKKMRENKFVDGLRVRPLKAEVSKAGETYQGFSKWQLYGMYRDEPWFIKAFGTPDEPKEYDPNANPPKTPKPKRDPKRDLPMPKPR